MTNFTFPFSSCEKPNKEGFVAQPYSTIVNIIGCIVTFFFLLKTKNIHSFLLLFFILCFELFHTFSHAIHIQGNNQQLVIHILSYFINSSLLYALYKKTEKFPDKYLIIFLLFFVSLDIYSLLNLSFIYYFITQTILFIGILFYYLPLLSKSIQKIIYYIALIGVLIVLLQMNEVINCEYMIQMNPDFPYHIIIEIAGFAFFYLFCSHFYNL